MDSFEKAAIKAYHLEFELKGYSQVKSAIESLSFSEAPYSSDENIAQVIEVENCEYLVIADEGLKEYYQAYCEEHGWTFNSSWVSNYTLVSEEVWDKVLSLLCEDANELVISSIKGAGNWDVFIEDSLSYAAEGLATYDSEEKEIFVGDECFHVYRLS